MVEKKGTTQGSRMDQEKGSARIPVWIIYLTAERELGAGKTFFQQEGQVNEPAKYSREL